MKRTVEVREFCGSEAGRVDSVDLQQAAGTLDQWNLFAYTDLTSSI